MGMEKAAVEVSNMHVMAVQCAFVVATGAEIGVAAQLLN